MCVCVCVLLFLNTAFVFQVDTDVIFLRDMWPLRDMDYGYQWCVRWPPPLASNAGSLVLGSS